MAKFSLLLAVIATLGTNACVAPPPDATAKAADPSAAPTAPDASKSAPPLAKPLLVWNGDDVNPAAKSWADCDSKPCTSAVAPTPQVGNQNTTGLEFRIDAPKGWAGFGWNFASWSPGAAINASGAKTLTFTLQIVAESAEGGPDLAALQVGLGCAKVKECAVGVTGIAKYEPAAADGNWHRIAIPLADMKPENAATWDPASVWELKLSHWAATPKKFVVHVDDIGFE